MSKRNKQPSQGALFALGRWPTWEAIAAAVQAQPRGSKVALAAYLGVEPSAVSEMLGRDAQPSYKRVVCILQWLEERGVRL